MKSSGYLIYALTRVGCHTPVPNLKSKCHFLEVGDVSLGNNFAYFQQNMKSEDH